MTKSAVTMGSTKNPSVALIGCGPSGMFFLHALATKVRQAKEIGDKHALTVLPKVVCFEKTDRPGGVWCHRRGDNACPTYQEMWANAPKETYEFSDYTFQTHFGVEVPTYLPAADVLDYMIKRSTSADPHLFQKGKSKKKKRYSEVRFNTTVNNIVYIEENKQFQVESTSASGDTIRESFDYCIWAAGKHNKPRIPRSVLNVLQTGVGPVRGDSVAVEEEQEATPFAGTVIHSTHSLCFDFAIREKRVVLIGDDGSAEDIALHAIRIGVKKVYILSRAGHGDCVYVGCWPGKLNSETGEIERQVEVKKMLPSRVVNGGTGLKCNEFCLNQQTGVFEVNESVPAETLQDIDSVIFCTGYFPGMDCLSDELKFRRADFEEWDLKIPADFKMRPNPYSAEVGDVVPSQELDLSGNLIPGLYRTVKVSNPQMMFLIDLNTNFRLLQLDVGAWLCLAYITGEANIPTQDEMVLSLQNEMLEEMQIPYLRWAMDTNYFNAINDLGEYHWSDDYGDPRCVEMSRQYCSHYVRTLARDMCEAKYPDDIGTYETLNEKGERLVSIALHNMYARHCLDDKDSDSAWRTFRDVDPAPFRSIHTKQASVPLPSQWLDLDEDEILRYSKIGDSEELEFEEATDAAVADCSKMGLKV